MLLLAWMANRGWCSREEPRRGKFLPAELTPTRKGYNRAAGKYMRVNTVDDGGEVDEELFGI